MLDDCKVWAVVGLSGDTRRTAFSIAALLQERGKQIVPIHPAAASDAGLTVLGEKGYPTLADVPFPVDVVDVFRRSEAAGEFADQAVEIGARGGVVPARGHRRRRVRPDGGGWGADGDGHLPGHRVAEALSRCPRNPPGGRRRRARRPPWPAPPP